MSVPSLGKVAVVTGGNKGIGYAIVKGLCEKFDGSVYLTSRDVARGSEAIKSLNEKGFHPLFYQLDVDDLESLTKFKEYIEQTHGGIDVLVNNAAIAFKHDASDPFGHQADVTLRTNYFGLLQTCEMLLPLLRNEAQIVNMSSCCGHLSKIPSPDLRLKLSSNDLTIDELTALMRNFIRAARDGKNVELGWGSSAYNVSKVGVSALTRVLQRIVDSEEDNRNVSVNCVHPGWVNTDMTSHKGPLSIEEGAAAPLFLSLEPHGWKGQYVWRDCQAWDWECDSTPAPF